MGPLPSQRRGRLPGLGSEAGSMLGSCLPQPSAPRTTRPPRLTLPSSPQTWGAVVSVPLTGGPRAAPQPPGSRGHHQPLCTFNTNLSDRKMPSMGAS